MSESKTDRSWKYREDGISNASTYDPNSHDELNKTPFRPVIRYRS